VKKLEIVNAVEELLSHAHTLTFTRKDKSRASELHPSSFPYCGLRDAYRRLNGDYGTYEDTLSSSYFTSIGTAVHSIFQKWLGFAKKDVVLIGDWKCLSCKKKQYFQAKPKSCKCGKPKFKYCELGGVYAGVVFWHCDGLVRIKMNRKFVYVLIDFKTSSKEAIDKYLQKGVGLPYKSNVAQIRSYAILAKRKYKIKISGAALIYLARDHPIKKYAVIPITISEEKRKIADQRLNKDARHFKIASQLKKKSELKILIREKPCRNRAEYKRDMYSFFSPCPLEKVCFNREKLVNTIKIALKKSPDLVK
jgi:hypothetical protein